MSREWCVAVRLLPGATAAEIGRVKTALAEREPKFDFDRDGDEFFVYVDEPHNARRTERAIMHVLAERGVADRVAEPLPIGRWHENAYRYVFPGGDPEPVVPADEIGWVVVVRPASAFEWRPLRTALEHLGRTMIRETGHAIEVGARDGETPMRSEQRWRTSPAPGKRRRIRSPGSSDGACENDFWAITQASSIRLSPRRIGGTAGFLRGSDATAGVGFEPTEHPAALSGFQDRPVRPLRHPA